MFDAFLLLRLPASVLPGTDTTDYVQRVEPSIQGGRKMAEGVYRKLKEALEGGGGSNGSNGGDCLSSSIVR